MNRWIRRGRRWVVDEPPLTAEERKERILAAGKRSAEQTIRETVRIDRLDAELEKLTKKGNHHG